MDLLLDIPHYSQHPYRNEFVKTVFVYNRLLNVHLTTNENNDLGLARKCYMWIKLLS